MICFSLVKGLRFLSYHRVCAWQVNTVFVLGMLTQGLHLISLVITGFVLGNLTQRIVLGKFTHCLHFVCNQCFYLIS